MQGQDSKILFFLRERERKPYFLLKDLMKSVCTSLFFIVTAPTILATVSTLNWYVELFV